ncbi:hypothetical protein CEXT_272591 [Caerostris extrusa]|uniref:Uncharacterized protein n=1 Tax=Caerostris extrusa TaxID=172846 RepID=A0AAV4TJ69_CAEEX|nr:hypothetical protein CEXT_272591 [Caerostris extrusa]
MEIAENRTDATVEVAKSLGGEGFDDMVAQNIRELLVEEEIDEAGLAEMISGIHDNSVDDSIEVKKFTLQSIKKGQTIRVIFYK